MSGEDTAYRRLLEDPHAPPWTHPREDRLTAAMRRQVDTHAVRLATEPPRWRGPDDEPAWLREWLAEVWPATPALARRGPTPARIEEIAPLRRADLAAAPWRHVPVGADLDNLLVYRTSGTAGAPVPIPSHPVTVASYYPTILHAAAAVAQVRPRPDRLDWVTIIAQEAGGYVIPSRSNWLGSLTAQVNLRPHAWRDPADAMRFLAANDPQVITGDPVAFAVLLDLLHRSGLHLRPRVLVSSASALSGGLRRRLAETFAAPVADVYSLTESGPVAVDLDGPDTTGITTHRLVQPRLFVEVLRRDGTRCAPGEVGEVTLTGGLNDVLPLVRYATGDHAAMQWPADHVAPVLRGLQGRTPVVFVTPEGREVNSHSVTIALEDLALPRFGLHQDAAGALCFEADDLTGVRRRQVAERVRGLFGTDVPIDFAAMPRDDTFVPFSSSRSGVLAHPPDSG